MSSTKKPEQSGEPIAVHQRIAAKKLGMLVRDLRLIPRTELGHYTHKNKEMYLVTDLQDYAARQRDKNAPK